MKEATLRDFFLGETTATALASDLRGSILSGGLAERRYTIQDMPGEFAIEPQHLIAVCDAALAGDLESEAIEAIGFCLAASDAFVWDSDTPDGERVADVVHSWSAPEINLPLTHDNVRRWREYLGAKGPHPWRGRP